MEWYLKVMRDNYANFSGRARRREYWMYVLVQTLIMIGLMILDNVLGLDFEFLTFFDSVILKNLHLKQLLILGPE